MYASVKGATEFRLNWSVF